MAEELDFETELQSALQAEPFLPFTLVLANGDRHQVDHPLRMSVGLDVVTIAYPFVRVIVRLFNIVAFEIHESAIR